ncbi:MAG: ABC transporter permease [Candidatus Aminicenantes bacterium]|nr:ABC transporter permease [Candidatus Aminicenantes bacterium]
MFDLETAIHQWKRALARNPGLEDGQRAELETCLRDEVSDLISQGLSAEDAFCRVSTEMGDADEMGLEFFKVYAKHPYGSPSWKRTSFAPALLWNYIKITFRKIKRQKGYSIINIVSLAVGLACCAVMMLWLQNEKSFDRFHTNRDSIFRMIKETQTSEKMILDARTPYPLGDAILGKIPEVKNFTRYQGVIGWEITYSDKTFFNDDLGTADSAFFEIFSFPFILGDPKTALSDRYSIVVTESMASKYFGKEEPMGKVMTMNQGRHSFKVTGVIRDVPENSHLRFDCIIPIVNFWEWWEGVPGDWDMTMFYTYVQLDPNGTAASAGPKISSVLNENRPESKSSIRLQPLMDVHLKSNFEWDLDNYAQGSQSTLTIFALAALSVLLLAMINFMNLSTARSANRAKEVGLRKVTGAKRTDIMGQFLGESVVLSFLGLIFALILVQTGLPFFNRLAGKNIVFSSLFEPQLIIILLGFTLLTGILSGSYPSFFLSAFQPTHVLRGEFLPGGRRQAVFRKSLVVVQFALTLFLVMGTTVVNRQLKFVRDKDLGIDTHNVVTFNGFFDQFPGARDIMLKNPNVISVTCSVPPELEQRGISDVSWKGKNPEDKILFFPVTVDADYLKTFRIGLAEGRFFSREFPSDQNDSLVINETAVRAMGMSSPVGNQVKIEGRNYNVIGVVKDFHQSSLHRPIEPMIFRAPFSFHRNCVRISPVNTKETIAFLEETMKIFLPKTPFVYEFIDDRIDGFYSSERKVQAILRLFTVIALFTACLGLFGLASFLAEKRTKEIGIRKILGAPVLGLIWLQTQEFSKWVLLSGLVASPAAYYATGRWLRGFAYHLNPSIGIFLSAVLATLLVALLAVGFQSVRAARANPVESLRYE